MSRLFLLFLATQAFADTCNPMKDDEEWCSDTSTTYTVACTNMCKNARDLCHHHWDDELNPPGYAVGCWDEQNTCENTEYLSPPGRCPTECQGTCWAKNIDFVCPPGTN